MAPQSKKRHFPGRNGIDLFLKGRKVTEEGFSALDLHSLVYMNITVGTVHEQEPPWLC